MIKSLWQALSRQQIGADGEDIAAGFLQRQGLLLHARNFHCKCGELDLVMQERDTLVFVEVRVRRRSDFGGALMSVTPAKQKKLIRAAQFFLQTHPQWQRHACRFDVVALEGDKPLQWLRNAFSLEE